MFYVNQYYFIDGLMYLLGFPLWFYLNLGVWYKPFSKDCLRGIIIMDFTNLMIIYLYVAAYVIAASFIVPCGLISSPCWGYKVYNE